MSEVTRTETFDIDIESFYNIITDYESYPDFVDGCDEVEIVKRTKSGARVRYKINILKSFSYVLDLKHDAPRKVSWKLESGDLFKVNNGSWELEDLGDGKTKVTYTLEMEFKTLIPQMVVNKLVTNNLPVMMKQYYKRAKNYGKKAQHQAKE